MLSDSGVEGIAAHQKCRYNGRDLAQRLETMLTAMGAASALGALLLVVLVVAVVITLGLYRRRKKHHVSRETIAYKSSADYWASQRAVERDRSGIHISPEERKRLFHRDLEEAKRQGLKSFSAKR
jgi:hypothetical protein